MERERLVGRIQVAIAGYGVVEAVSIAAKAGSLAKRRGLSLEKAGLDQVELGSLCIQAARRNAKEERR